MPVSLRTNSVFFGYSTDRYVPRNPRRLGFDEGSGYDRGRIPACAVNGNNHVVTLHAGETTTSGTLNARIAEVDGVSLNFLDDPQGSFATGNNPSVALNNKDVVVAMYDKNNKLQYQTGTLTIDRSKEPHVYEIAWDPAVEIADDAPASDPSIALRSGVALEVHQSGAGIYWRRGRLDDKTLTWQKNATLLDANGSTPSVAINNNGQAVAVFARGGQLFYSVGTFEADSKTKGDPVTWTTATTAFATSGTNPSVALTSDNDVFIVYTDSGKLYQMVGTLSGTSITFNDIFGTRQTAYLYDTQGTTPAVATNGKLAVQVHGVGSNLQGNASLVFDRRNWMHDNRAALGAKTLRTITLPASHDSGAFADNLARTQDLTIASQIVSGVRYFDLRPKYTGDKTAQDIDSNLIVTYHDIPAGDFLGPSLANVFDHVRTYMENHKELVILKISHFKNFNVAVFTQLVADILTRLSPYLYAPPDDNVRLAERTLSTIWDGTKGRVLVFADRVSVFPETNDGDDFVTPFYRSQGILRYRDWYDDHPEQGDITVFDLFSGTLKFDDMASGTDKAPDHAGLPGHPGQKVPVGQLPKYDWFDGKCQGRGNTASTVQCDLFLLSWTLTPPTPAVDGTPFVNARNAAANLVPYLNIPLYTGANPQGLQMNLLYTDAVEYSRSVDAAMVRNGLV